MNGWITNKILRILDVEIDSASGIKIGFYIETVLSEVEKIVIVFVFYTMLGYCDDIVTVLSVLLLLRPYIGGTHQNTFLKCLGVTIVFCAVPIYLAGEIRIIAEFQILATVVMMWIIGVLGPVASKYRPEYSGDLLQNIKVKGMIMLILVDIVYCFLNNVLQIEVTILLYMLITDVTLARVYQIIITRRGEHT